MRKVNRTFLTIAVFILCVAATATTAQPTWHTKIDNKASIAQRPHGNEKHLLKKENIQKRYSSFEVQKPTATLNDPKHVHRSMTDKIVRQTKFSQPAHRPAAKLADSKYQKEIKIRLDSVTYYGDGETETAFFTYENTHIAKVEEMWIYWDEDNSREYGYKFISTFTSGKLSQEIESIRDEDTKAWIDSYRVNYTYRGDTTEEIVGIWDEGNKVWVNDSKSEYTYDNNGNPSMSISYDWDDVNRTWKESNKYEYAFDDNDKQTMYAYYYWDDVNMVWKGNYKQESTSDDNGIQTMDASYNWDDIKNIWVGSYKNEYTYDNNGNITMDVSYDWDDVKGIWVGSYKREYAYDNNDNEIMQTSYNWDKMKGIWVGSYKQEYAYNNNGKPSMDASYNWDDVNRVWIGQGKREYAYDQYNNDTSISYFSWNNAQWKVSSRERFNYLYTFNIDNRIIEAIKRRSDTYPDISDTVSKYECTYDNDGKQTMYADYYWSNENRIWIGSSKYESTYDNNGNSIMRIYYSWDDVNRIWIGSVKQEYTYDDNDRQTMIATYYWDDVKNTWKGYYKYEYAYDDNDNQTMYASYDWDDVNRIWIGDSKYERAYDDNGYEIMHTFYDWDGVNGAWVKKEKQEYIFNESYSISDLLLPGNDAWWYPSSEFMIVEGVYYKWDDAAGDWSTTTYSSIYHYSSVDVDDVSVKDISRSIDDTKVYPNPAHHTLYIESSETVKQVSVYDISGRALMQVANPVLSIDINNLAKGIYLVKVRTAQGETVRKIVKQ